MFGRFWASTRVECDGDGLKFSSRGRRDTFLNVALLAMYVSGIAAVMYVYMPGLTVGRNLPELLAAYLGGPAVVGVFSYALHRGWTSAPLCQVVSYRGWEAFLDAGEAFPEPDEVLAMVRKDPELVQCLTTLGSLYERRMERNFRLMYRTRLGEFHAALVKHRRGEICSVEPVAVPA